MPSLTIRLEIDPVTKKKNVVIDYTSDADALPMEHEEEHRRLVDKLIEGGALKASELGTISVRREQSNEAQAGEAHDDPAAEKTGQKA